MKAQSKLISFSREPSGLWLCTIRGGHERLGNEQEFTNRGHSPRHAYRRAKTLRRRIGTTSELITCSCHSCQESLAHTGHTAEDDQVLGPVRVYQRPPLPPVKASIPSI